MAHYRTAYEITATNGERTFLIAYTPRVSRIGLLKAMQKRSAQIIKKLGVGDKDEISFATQPRVHCTLSGWTVGFTGRTECEAKQAGEHEYVGSSVTATAAPEVAAWIDPDGSLQRAGLLSVA